LASSVPGSPFSREPNAPEKTHEIVVHPSVKRDRDGAEQADG
jgi:hypothetical protein